MVLKAAGFADIAIRPTHEVADGMHSAIIRARRNRPTLRRSSPHAGPDSTGRDDEHGVLLVRVQAGTDLEVREQGAHPAADLVADGSDCGDIEPRRIVQLPVLVALARKQRAGIAAPHGDHDVGGLHDLVGPRLRVFTGDVDTDLGHRRDRRRVDLDAWLGSARPRDRPVPGEMVEPAESHLRSPRVVDTQEQHDRCAVADLALDLGQRLQALAGERSANNTT